MSVAHVSFTVHGQNYEEMRASAEKRFQSWLGEPSVPLSETKYRMSVSPEVETGAGEVALWRADVEIEW